MYKTLLFLLLLCSVITSVDTACSWSKKTVRILVIIDDLREDLISDFMKFTSKGTLNKLYENPDICVPNINFRYLKINESSDEITTLQNTYISFARSSFCIVILASSSRKTRYAMEYTKSQQIPVISIVPTVRITYMNISYSFPPPGQ